MEKASSTDRDNIHQEQWGWVKLLARLALISPMMVSHEYRYLAGRRSRSRRSRRRFQHHPLHGNVFQAINASRSIADIEAPHSLHHEELGERSRR